MNAEKLMTAGNWEAAIEMFSQVPDYADAGERIVQAEYEWAMAMMAKHSENTYRRF